MTGLQRQRRRVLVDGGQGPLLQPTSVRVIQRTVGLYSSQLHCSTLPGVKPRSQRMNRIAVRELQLAQNSSVNTHTHTHPFNGPFSGTTRVSRYQKGNTNLDFCEARDSEWQWHQLGRMQVCTSLQTDNHACTQQLSFYRPDALPAAQPTASKH